jgi:hypothetical protein
MNNPPKVNYAPGKSGKGSGKFSNSGKVGKSKKPRPPV